MKNCYVVFLLLIALVGCENNKVWINDFTFYIDGVHYDLSRINEERVRSNEFGVAGCRYSANSPLDSLYYYFMGYNSTSMNGAYGGEFFDRSVQKETMFEVPNSSIGSYFWIRINNKTYDAISGYIEMINDTKRFFSGTANYHHKAHGTFYFVMVNRYDELDTIHVTNGKFRYQPYWYGEAYIVRN